jgi:hypothetical protein
VFANRTFYEPNWVYSIDYQNASYDLFHIVERRVADFENPQTINLRINNTNVLADKFLTFGGTHPNRLTFTKTANIPTELTAQINATLSRLEPRQYSATFNVLGNKVNWTVTIPLFSTHQNCTKKWSMFYLPENWDMSTIHFTNANVSYNVISGTLINVTDTKGLTSLQFTIQSDNVITDVSSIPDRFSDEKIPATWSGLSADARLRVELWCNGSYVTTLATNQQFGVQHNYTIPQNVLGHGYTLRGYWSWGSTVGYKETNQFSVTVRPSYAPNAPVLGQSQPSVNGTVYLNWTAIPAVGGYDLYRSTSCITNVSGLTPVATNVQQTQFTDQLTMNGTYYYAVVAKNASGQSAPSNCLAVEVTVTRSGGVNQSVTPTPTDNDNEPLPPPGTIIPGIPNSLIYFIAVMVVITVVGILRSKKS